jgi:hypothetical protein
MERERKLKVAAAGAAALVVAGGGGAVAATQMRSPAAESQAVVSNAAKRLGVKPSELGNALKSALKDRIDAAVHAGRLTRAQGDALKARIDSGDFPLFGGPVVGPPHGFADLEAAAAYLGLSESALDAKLEAGKTLAQVAKEAGKPVGGLVSALVDATRRRLDDAVADGRITRAQEQRILSDVKRRIRGVVEGRGPRWFDRGQRPGGFGFPNGPPDSAGAAA